VAGFLVDRNITPIYDSIRKIDLVNGTLLDYFKNAYSAEQKTTEAVMSLYKQAHDENEFLVIEFLMFFLNEQRRSEREVWDIIQAFEASDEWRLIDEKLGE
jgi:ferritin